MATRFYLPSAGSAPVSPASWLFPQQATSPLTLPALTAVSTTAMTSKTESRSATVVGSPVGMFRWVSRALAAQTVSGTISGQMRGLESTTSGNCALALAIKVVQSDGTDRGTLLAVTGSTNSITPPEFTTAGLTNRSHQNTAGTTSLPLTSVVCSAGDFVVVEIGFIQRLFSVAWTVTLSYGDDSATDLPVDQTTTAANNPWVEFSNSITFQSAGGAPVLRGGVLHSKTVRGGGMVA